MLDSILQTGFPQVLYQACRLPSSCMHQTLSLLMGRHDSHKPPLNPDHSGPISLLLPLLPVRMLTMMLAAGGPPRPLAKHHHQAGVCCAGQLTGSAPSRVFHQDSMPRAFSATPASLRVRTHSSHAGSQHGPAAAGHATKGGLQRQALNARRRKRHGSPQQQGPNASTTGEPVQEPTTSCLPCVRQEMGPCSTRSGAIFDVRLPCKTILQSSAVQRDTTGYGFLGLCRHSGRQQG